MSRIFPSLASLSLIAMILAMALGLSIGDLYQRPVDPAALAWRGRHMLAGTGAALAVVLVESIAVTYFVGTSRWCKEVTLAYDLPPDDLVESNRLKRRAFPWGVAGMLTVVAVGALGAASDPGTGRQGTASTANYHLWAALAGAALVAVSYYQIWLRIVENQAVIGRIVEAVGAIRQQQGLDGPDLDGSREFAAAASQVTEKVAT